MGKPTVRKHHNQYWCRERNRECLTRLGNSLVGDSGPLTTESLFAIYAWWPASPCPCDESAGKASMPFFLLQGQPHHKMPGFYGSWLQCWLRLEAEFLFQPADVCRHILDPGHDFWPQMYLEWQVDSIIKRSPRLVCFLRQNELFLLPTKHVNGCSVKKRLVFPILLSSHGCKETIFPTENGLDLLQGNTSYPTHCSLRDHIW